MNQRNEAMLTVQQTGFAVTELALYLDTHPTDAAALSAMRTAADEYDAAVSAYERQYGPLSIKNRRRSGLLELELRALAMGGGVNRVEL